jgi:hypothetical protein
MRADELMAHVRMKYRVTTEAPGWIGVEVDGRPARVDLVDRGGRTFVLIRSACNGQRLSASEALQLTARLAVGAFCEAQDGRLYARETRRLEHLTAAELDEIVPAICHAAALARQRSRCEQLVEAGLFSTLA